MIQRSVGLVFIALLATLWICGARADEPIPLNKSVDGGGEETKTDVPKELPFRPKLIFTPNWLDYKDNERREHVFEADERRDLEEFLRSSLSFESGRPLPPFIGCGETVVEIRAPLDFSTAWYYCVKKLEGGRLLVVDGEREIWFDRKDVASQQQVEKAMSRHLALHPQCSTTRVERAKLRTWMQRYDGAISDYSAAIRIHPKNSTLYSARSRLWSYKGQFAPAIDDATECLELEPTYVRGWSSRGRLRFEAREYTKALADYNEGVARGDASSRTLEDRAAARVALKDFNGAMADLNEAIRLDASNSTAYMLRGLIFKSLHQENNALQDFNEALRLDPENTYLLETRMWMWFATSNSERAEADATALLKLIPDCAEAFHARGDARAMQGRFEQAREDFLKALVQDPKNTWIREKLVACWVEVKNYDQALAELNRVVELEPRRTDLLVNRAGLHMFREEYEAVVKDASKVVEVEPKNSKAYMIRAVAYQELESSDLEKADLDRVIALADEFLEEALWQRAWLRATCPRAEYRDAKGALEDALVAACRSCWPRKEYAGLQLGGVPPEHKLQTVGAVLAENQQFLLAALVQELAIHSAKSDGDRRKAQERLDDYRAGKPWRETKIR